MVNIQGTELYFGDLKCLRRGLCLDAYGPVSFKLDLMIDMTELYILIPV